MDNMNNNNIVVSENSGTGIALIENVDSQMVATTLRKISEFQAVIQTALVDGKDYGIIPGAGSKPSLFKPGAEKVNMLFGINPEYEFLKAEEDFKNGFFNYNIRCTLYRNGNPVSQGVGSCNSMEKKYRYINVDEKGLKEAGVPKETAVLIGTFYGTEKYRIPNPEPASLANTILKMAKKRAYVDATLQVASLSDLFTQDLEDLDTIAKTEAVETMDEKNAENIKINFGKYKGSTMGEVFLKDRNYIEWIAENSKDAVIKKAAKMLVDSLKKTSKPRAGIGSQANSNNPPEGYQDEMNIPNNDDIPPFPDDEDLPF